MTTRSEESKQFMRETRFVPLVRAIGEYRAASRADAVGFASATAGTYARLLEAKQALRALIQTSPDVVLAFLARVTP